MGMRFQAALAMASLVVVASPMPAAVAADTDFEERFADLVDKWYANLQALFRGPVEDSGEPYPELIDQCVTISTDLLGVTGKYLGMSGPSVKSPPRHGFFGSTPRSKGEDRLKVLVGIGSMEYFATVELPAPPREHLRLLKKAPSLQALNLAEWVESIGHTCKRPEKPFFRGLDLEGEAHWAVTCETGESYSVEVRQSDEFASVWPCQSGIERLDIDCYSRCARQSCYRLDPSAQAMGTVESIPYSESPRVRPVPDELCGEVLRAGHIMQGRARLPELQPGEMHELATHIADAPDCASSESPTQLALEIFAAHEKDLLKVDVASIEAQSLQLDYSAGPPCELVHINAIDDRYADLRCRLVGDVAAALAAGPRLTVRGRFNNGDPFEGLLTVCSTSDAGNGEEDAQ